MNNIWHIQQHHWLQTSSTTEFPGVRVFMAHKTWVDISFTEITPQLIPNWFTKSWFLLKGRQNVSSPLVGVENKFFRSQTIVLALYFNMATLVKRGQVLTESSTEIEIDLEEVHGMFTKSFTALFNLHGHPGKTSPFVKHNCYELTSILQWPYRKRLSRMSRSTLLSGAIWRCLLPDPFNMLQVVNNDT